MHSGSSGWCTCFPCKLLRVMSFQQRLQFLRLFAVGHRNGSGLPEERQHGALLPEAGVGSDQVLPGGDDESGGQ